MRVSKLSQIVLIPRTQKFEDHQKKKLFCHFKRNLIRKKKKTNSTTARNFVKSHIFAVIEISELNPNRDNGYIILTLLTRQNCGNQLIGNILGILELICQRQFHRIFTRNYIPQPIGCQNDHISGQDLVDGTE